MKSAHDFFASYIRKGIDIKKFKRIEPTKEENKKLKVAAYCKVSKKLKANKVELIYKFLIMKPSYKVTVSGNMQEFITIMAVD